jgi:hypothetical protein
MGGRINKMVGSCSSGCHLLPAAALVSVSSPDGQFRDVLYMHGILGDNCTQHMAGPCLALLAWLRKQQSLWDLFEKKF